MQRSKIVCVEWEDASFSSGFYDKKDPKRFDPIPARTVGYLVKSDRAKVIVATEKFIDYEGVEDLRHIHTIPRKLIKSIRRLE